MPSRRAAVTPTASVSRACVTRPRSRATRSSRSSEPSAVSSESLPSSTSMPGASSSAGTVRPNRNRFELGHHTTAAPAARSRWMPRASTPTACTASRSAVTRPRASSSRTSSAAAELTPSARWMANGAPFVAAGNADARRSESAVSMRATRSGKSWSKSSSHASWCTTVVTPARRFFHAPRSSASRRGIARPRAMRFGESVMDVLPPLVGVLVGRMAEAAVVIAVEMVVRVDEPRVQNAVGHAERHVEASRRRNDPSRLDAERESCVRISSRTSRSPRSREDEREDEREPALALVHVEAAGPLVEAAHRVVDRHHRAVRAATAPRAPPPRGARGRRGRDSRARAARPPRRGRCADVPPPPPRGGSRSRGRHPSGAHTRASSRYAGSSAGRWPSTRRHHTTSNAPSATGSARASAAASSGSPRACASIAGVRSIPSATDAPASRAERSRRAMPQPTSSTRLPRSGTSSDATTDVSSALTAVSTEYVGAQSA